MILVVAGLDKYYVLSSASFLISNLIALLGIFLVCVPPAIVGDLVIFVYIKSVDSF